MFDALIAGVSFGLYLAGIVVGLALPVAVVVVAVFCFVAWMMPDKEEPDNPVKG